MFSRYQKILGVFGIEEIMQCANNLKNIMVKPKEGKIISVANTKKKQTDFV